jgi:eukaryotic-like serine/threonine-protein kinase
MTMLGDSVRRRQGRRASAPRREPRAGRRPWLKWLPWAVAAVVLPFGIGYALAVYVLFPPPGAAAIGLPVPAVVGMSAGEAERALQNTGLGGVEVTELPHPQLAAGIVVAQSPLPGQHLRAGAIVRVAVSAGRPRGVVPDVVGFHVDRAFALLARLGFEVERRLEESDAPEGRVLRVDPQPGSERELPARVTLSVSEGLPAPEPLPRDEPVDTVPGAPDVPPAAGAVAEPAPPGPAPPGSARPAPPGTRPELLP